jgi:putative spermidine/putrescine transport system substrate-binding protein
MSFRDIGDMSKSEIDKLTKILLKLKKGGQFRSFWETYADAVELMLSREVVVASMWSPMIAQLQARRAPVRYAAPPEGFRGWSNGLAISSQVKDASTLQAAYEYINWWHDGYAGAVMMRQGYYNAVQATSRRFVDPSEWGFWIEGKRATKNLAGPFGDVSIHKGQRRDGGSFAKRARNFACWLSFFREHVHETNRWQELLAA